MKRILMLILMLTLFMGVALAEESEENEALFAIGDELLERTRALLADEAYWKLYLDDEDVHALHAQWAQSMEDVSVQPEVYAHPQWETLYALILAVDGEAHGLSGEALDSLETMTVSMLANVTLNRMGAVYMTAAAAFDLQDFYPLPEDFSDCVLVYRFSDIGLAIECTREQAGEAEFLYARAYLCAPDFRPTLLGLIA